MENPFAASSETSMFWSIWASRSNVKSGYFSLIYWIEFAHIQLNILDRQRVFHLVTVETYLNLANHIHGTEKVKQLSKEKITFHKVRGKKKLSWELTANKLQHYHQNGTLILYVYWKLGNLIRTAIVFWKTLMLKSAQLKHYPEIYALNVLVEQKGQSTKSPPVPASQDFISHHLHHSTSLENSSLGKAILDSSEALPEKNWAKSQPATFSAALVIFTPLLWCLPFHVWGNCQKRECSVCCIDTQGESLWLKKKKRNKIFLAKGNHHIRDQITWTIVSRCVWVVMAVSVAKVFAKAKRSEMP